MEYESKCLFCYLDRVYIPLITDTWSTTTGKCELVISYYILFAVTGTITFNLSKSKKELQ